MFNFSNTRRLNISFAMTWFSTLRSMTCFTSSTAGLFRRLYRSRLPFLAVTFTVFSVVTSGSMLIFSRREEFFFSVTVCGRYPTILKCSRVSTAVTLRSNCPLMSDTVPYLVPGMAIWTKASGSPVRLSVTVPEMGDFICPQAPLPITTTSNTKTAPRQNNCGGWDSTLCNALKIIDI